MHSRQIRLKNQWLMKNVTSVCACLSEQCQKSVTYCLNDPCVLDIWRFNLLNSRSALIGEHILGINPDCVDPNIPSTWCLFYQRLFYLDQKAKMIIYYKIYLAFLLKIEVGAFDLKFTICSRHRSVERQVSRRLEPQKVYPWQRYRPCQTGKTSHSCICKLTLHYL